MRIIAYGREKTIRELEVCLSGNGIELVDFSGKPEKLMAIVKQNNAYLIAVDVLAEEAEELCNNIRLSCNLPIVIVMEKSDLIDWKRLRLLDVEGYLSLKESKAALLASVKAIIRRTFHPNRKASTTNYAGIACNGNGADAH